MQKPIRAILFDLDDTLIDSERIYRECLASVLPESLSTEEFHEKYLVARQTVKERLGPGHPLAHSRLLYFKELFQDLRPFSAPAVLATMERYEASLQSLARENWLSLRRPALFHRLSARFKLGIVTNENTRTQLIKLGSMDPEARIFSTLITSEEMGCEKPNILMFEEAARQLGVSLDECAVVGDQAVTDLDPPRSRGATTLWTREFRNGNAGASATLHRVITRLDEVEGAIG